jgi:agmatine deiminase
MVVDPTSVEIAKEWLDPAVEMVVAPLDDSWMRDIGPTFVRAADGSLAAVDWVFNGWGAQHWAKWDHDSKIASVVISQAGVPTVASTLVNEGGGIHVNGRGTLLATKTVQFDPYRNPEATFESVEAEFKRTIGVDEVIWFERGLTRDYEDFGTRGHVDIVACFADENTILFHDQQNPAHPDYEVSQEVREVLEKTKFNIVAVPAPEVIEDQEGFVDYSYINHYICNGAVILCAFADPADERAKSILEKAYPGREIVLVDAREIFHRGGGIHCITQQQPSA